MIRLLIIGILFLLLFITQRWIYSKIWHKQLSVRLNFSINHLFVGEQGELKEIIENKKRFPLSMLKVKFSTDKHLVFEDTKGSRTTDQFYRNDIFRIGGRERVTRTLKFTGQKRGYYTIENVCLVASDLFLTGQMVSDIPVHTEVYIYPKPWLNEEMLRCLSVLNGEVLAKRHLLEDPFEYRGIRDYQPYDDLRSINWKATAKTDDLKVNQKNYTALKSIRIFFDIQDEGIIKKEDSVEMILAIVTGLCAYFLKQGIQVSCFGNGRDILTDKHVFIPAKAGNGQLDSICRSLSRIDTSKQAVDFSKSFESQLFSSEESYLTCFVSSNLYEDFTSLLERYKDSGKEFVWFYPVKENKNPKFPPSLSNQIQPVHFG